MIYDFTNGRRNKIDIGINVTPSELESNARVYVCVLLHKQQMRQM